ncbi:hypothetical protein CASFOL_006472 [Castilleja foliolosa]|uniref:TF-B3 domain-containing protein n=1 Tax=Castilleja foliolosa TaxID=1961234 RepID=A0ABD3E7E6_9LAMI
MSESRDVPGSSKKNAAEENPSEKWPGPMNKLFTCKAYCFSRILTPADVKPTNPELCIDACQGLFLFDSPETKFFAVYDENQTKSYNMLFSHYVTWQFIRYSITGDWKTFVTDHNLKAGDEISFYRFVEENDCNGYFYVLKFDKNPSGCKDGEIVSDDETLRKKKILPGPGSSPMPIESCCLWKIITPREVIEEKLYFDTQWTAGLTGSPDIVDFDLGTNPKDLFVFDKDDRQYTMKLSQCDSGGLEMGYVLNTGWATFLRIHGLKKGDRILLYKFNQKSVFEDDCYYSLRSETSDGLAAEDPVVANERLSVYMKDKEDHIKRMLEMRELLERRQPVPLDG